MPLLQVGPDFHDVELDGGADSFRRKGREWFAGGDVSYDLDARRAGGHRLAGLVQQLNAPGDFGAALQVAVTLHQAQVVVHYRRAADLAAVLDVPHGGRDTVLVQELFDEVQNALLSRAKGFLWRHGGNLRARVEIVSHTN